MENKKVVRIVDTTGKTIDEIIHVYASISENIIMMSSLLDIYKDKAEAIRKYQIIKNEK